MPAEPSPDDNGVPDPANPPLEPADGGGDDRPADLTVCATWDDTKPGSPYLIEIKVDGLSRKMKRGAAIAFALAVFKTCADASTIAAVAEHIARLGKGDIAADAIQYACRDVAVRLGQASKADTAPLEFDMAVGRDRTTGQFVPVIFAKAGQWAEKSTPSAWEHFALAVLREAHAASGNDAYFQFLTKRDRDSALPEQVARGAVYEMTEVMHVCAQERDERRDEHDANGPLLLAQRHYVHPQMRATPDGGVLVSAGIKQHFDPATRSLPGFGKVPGLHLWTVNNSYRIADPWQPGPFNLDTENLLFATPILCYHCAQVWSQDLDTPCPGEPAAAAGP